MVDCNEVLEQLSEYLDEEAREDLCRSIEQHLHQCKDCRFFVDTVKKTIMLYRADRLVEMPPAVTDQLQAALSREYGDTVEDPSS